MDPALAAPRMPNVFAGGRWWPADVLESLAWRWRAAALLEIARGSQYLATAPPTTPQGIALFAALSSLPVPMILLTPDPGVWHGLGRLPPRTSLLLLPSLAGLASAAEGLGCRVTVLPDAGSHADCQAGTLLQSPGVVMFTSGSTGSPKPVFRAFAAIAGAAGARLAALGVRPGDGIVAGASLAHARGTTCLVSAMTLGGPLGLLDPLSHRAALAALALPEFAAWWATAPFADALGRCALTGPAVVPKVCLLSNPIPRKVFDRFVDRFGVPIRQTYASTETGCLTVDNAPTADVRPDTVGRPVSGVEVRIGDHPAAPLPCGEAGRIWVRSPWRMADYGFPPSVDGCGSPDDWWPTRDVGFFDGEGRLSLSGRLDDCIRTREGLLVNLATVARQLSELNGISEVAVVPVDGQAGASFGAVLECDPSLPLHALRLRISDALPAWARPRKLALVTSLPRLPNGKPDRLACIAVLARGSGR
jgi:acyl-coenzyme A synthetase/AMP-(fatty) acid ligase